MSNKIKHHHLFCFIQKNQRSKNLKKITAQCRAERRKEGNISRHCPDQGFQGVLPQKCFESKFGDKIQQFRIILKYRKIYNCFQLPTQVQLNAGTKLVCLSWDLEEFRYYLGEVS